MTDAEIRRLAEENEAFAIETRRALHEIPEPGFAEYETQKTITRLLDEMGIPYKTERTWVVGFIKGAYPGKVVALRADMDALPVTENNGLPYASKHPGYMHACGHDMHMTMLITAAKILNGMKERMHGGVKLLFQPAEETTGGGKPMVDAGCLENPHVDCAFGIHVQSRLPLGVVECRAGAFCASTDEVCLRVIGKGGHGAYPETGADAIAAACGVVTGLQSLIPRAISPIVPAILHFGTIQGGVANNVLAEEVTLRGSIRCADAVTRAFLCEQVAKRAGALAEGFGCRAEVTVNEGYAALVNHAAEAKMVLNTAARLFGGGMVIDKEAPSMGGEDFSYFIENTPGAFFNIGCSEDVSKAYPLHSAGFMPDERCMRTGVMMHLALVNEILQMN